MAIPSFMAADATTGQFPDIVRARHAANLADPSTPEGAAIARLTAASGGGSAAAPTPAVPYSIAGWGDSITETGSGTDSWIDLLALSTGLPAYNGGKWGQSSPQVAARQGGALAMLTFPDNQMPASGQVTVTADVNPLGGSYSGSRVGVSHGVPGTLSWDQPSNTLTWSRTTAGSAVALTGPVKFVPADAVRPANREAIQIFWIGRNGAQDVAGNLTALKRMAAYANGRFLVLSVLPWAGQVSPDPTNYAYLEAFPEQYRDIGAWLRTADAATAAGITFTTDDQADIAAGLTPRSLRADDVHPNAAGRKAIAAYMVAELRKLGWVSTTPYSAPALPVAATNRWDLSGRAAGQSLATVPPIAGSVALTQATAASQPVAVADALFKRNPALVGAASIGGYLAATPAVATVTFVGRLTDATDANGKLFVNLLGVLVRVNGGKYGTYATSGGAAISSTLAADAAPHVFTVVLNGSTSALWVDGVKYGTGTAAPSTAVLNIGGGAGFEALELVYNDSVLSDANITATAAALRNGYVK